MRLAFKGIIHAVGPRQGEGNEEAKLVQALSSAFLEARKREWNSLAFPAVSSGIFAVPLEVCARAYAKAARASLPTCHTIRSSIVGSVPGNGGSGGGASVDVNVEAPKVDAPSGTALLLGEAAAEGRGIDFRAPDGPARYGHNGAREQGTIGFASLRGGTVAGEHTVILAGEQERLTLSHSAEDRMIFAHGAVRGAAWLIGRPAGRYTMAQVLGL